MTKRVHVSVMQLIVSGILVIGIIFLFAGCNRNKEQESYAVVLDNINVEEIAPSFPFYKMHARDEFWYIQEEKTFDSNGVIMRDYGEQGLQYHPVMIASYAIRLYDTFLKAEDRNALQKFLVQANWLRDSLQEWVPGVWAWIYNIPNIAYKATGQWISGMAQGLGLAVLAEAYSITKDSSYIEAGQKALSPFSVNLVDGNNAS